MSIQWSLVIFTLLTGAGGCLFAFVGANELGGWSKKSGLVPAIVALVLAAVGGLASVTHLSHPDRIMNALSHPTSGIFTEAVLVAILAVCIAVYLICAVRSVSAGAKIFGVAGAVVGVLLSFMAGYSYIMVAQEAWNSVLLPIGYLTTALPIGAGLWWALAAPDTDNGWSVAAVAAIACSIVGLVGLAAYTMGSGTLGLGFGFEIVALVAEVVAVALAFAGRSKPAAVWPWLFVAAAVAAGLFFRMYMWVVGGNICAFFG